MSKLRVVPIVEGHGEYAAIAKLLKRVWKVLLDGDYLEVLETIRHPAGSLKKQEGLQKAVSLGARKLKNLKPQPGVGSLVLVLIDSDDDCPVKKCPEMNAWANEVARGIDVSCLMAVFEFETWFVATAESLAEFLDVKNVPADPEATRSKKGWIEKYFRREEKRRSYSPSIDMPKMTDAMDLAKCHEKSRSFRKLCRELEKRRTAASSEEGKA